MYVQFFKVNSLPVSGVPNAWYLVLNGNYSETYVTDNTGVFKRVGNSLMINELITQALDGLNTTEVVNNITDRDNLTLSSNTLVYVIDATGDVTVNSGAALYIYKHSTTSFHKIAEYESIDLSIDWVNISGKPTSTPTQIDQAVTNSHTHTNKTVLDNIQEALTTVLKSGYDGVVNWVSTNGSNLLNHLSNTSNPHNVTKLQVGLGNVPDLDTTSTISNSHTHSNKPLLDSYTQTESDLQSSVVNRVLSVMLNSDVINNNAVANTLQDVTGLSFPVVNGKQYWFRFVILYTAQVATTGSRWTINTPTFSTLTYKSEYTLTETTITINEGLQAVNLPATSNASSLLNGNIAIIEGILNATSAGSVIARFASEIANSAITAKVGSFVEYRQLN